MKERIWNDLRNSIFYIEYLSLYLNRVKRCNRTIEILLLMTSLLSIVSWYGLAEYNKFWATLLLLVALIRILKSYFMVSPKTISTFESLRNFYMDHYMDLENLWYKHKNRKISDAQAEKIYTKLNEAERLIIKIEKHDKLFGQDSMHLKAEKLANQKLIKYVKKEK